MDGGESSDEQSRDTILGFRHCDRAALGRANRGRNYRRMVGGPMSTRAMWSFTGSPKARTDDPKSAKHLSHSRLHIPSGQILQVYLRTPNGQALMTLPGPLTISMVPIEEHAKRRAEKKASE